MKIRQNAKKIKHTVNDVANVIRFLILHLSAFSVFFVGYSHFAFSMFFLFYLIRFAGVSIAYHRYFAHRSFKTTRLFQFLLGLLGTTSGQRGPLWWAAGHRKHHRYSDTKKDIHSPHHKTLWFSHIGWVLTKESLETDYQQMKDFENYPELKWLNQNNSTGVILSFIFLFILGTLLKNYAPQLQTNGAQLLVWGGILSTLLCCHSVLALNSVCHITGSKAYPTKDKSTNVWWMFPFLLGEQYHNNHHYFPSSHRASFVWYEFDQMGFTIRVLESIGLVWDLKNPSNERAKHARLDYKDQAQEIFSLPTVN